MSMSLVCAVGEGVSIPLAEYITYNTWIYIFQKGTCLKMTF